MSYLHIRSVDAIRYEIYKYNNNYYVNYNNKTILINLPEKFRNIETLTIVLSDATDYKKYEIERNNNFPYIFIKTLKKNTRNHTIVNK